MRDGVGRMVHAERAALIDDLTRLGAGDPGAAAPGGDADLDAPAPLDTRLVEEVFHGKDIRRPLGLVRTYAPEAAVRTLRVQARTSVSFGGAKQLLARVRLTATDFDLPGGTGQGAEVSGTALALLLAVSRRRVALDELQGPGVRMAQAASSWWLRPGTGFSRCAARP